MVSPDDRRIPLAEDELREVAAYAAACARSALPLFESISPADARPREAIAAAEAFAAGQPRTAALRAAAWSAYAAAREADVATAAHAAHAASHAAAAAYLHPIADAHQVKHILGAAAHQALAFESDAGGDGEVGDARVSWAAGLASATVREVLLRYPSVRRGRGRGRMSELLFALDGRLRD
ncbi:hypothetical protein J5226_19835 [Lysobacter sp. K5869]|uniref:putative immunity protein n=1 Tax=Lysobacter sp. K5869 TaxID=2820808 RepID=UPI001C061A60|nr:hypothetical protein [Lysobacter sp. K5869]QWP75836.1 hypothetical protein J5226_19835 [Lysobacter sp. K5869]